MANWFAKMFRRQPPEDWGLVKEIDLGYTLTNVDESKNTKHEFTYYLYESDRGNRKFDVVDGRLGDLDLRKMSRITNPLTTEEWELRRLYRFIYSNEEFRKTLRPWLDGRNDPKIPRYSDIPKEEFRDALAGERK